MAPLARILMVEDVASDAELIERELRRAGLRCATRRVDTEADVRDALRTFDPDIVLSDHSLPGFTARDTLRLVHQETPQTPVIIVTGSLDEEIAAEYIKAGATDYVVKDHLERLGPAVQRALDLRRARDEQAQAEEARRQGEERFRALIEHGTDAIALLGADGAVLFLSQSGERLFGYRPSELVGRSAFELLHPHDVPRLRAVFDDLLGRPGTPATLELRLLQRDGAWREGEAVVVNRLAEPAVGAVVVNFRDVSERKQAEQALRDSEAQYRSLVEGVRDVIFALSPDGIIVSLNPAFEAITGAPPSEWLGKPFDQLVHPEDLPLALELFGRVVRGEPRPTAQFRIRTSSTADYRLTEFAATAQLRDDRLIGVLGIGRDVTERVLLEQQLRQAQKMEAVGRLAGGIAHDFNNILTAITGYADLLLEDLGPKDPRRQDAEEIHRAADRAAGLTRQLLAFSRQQVLQPRVVDVNKLVSELEKMLRRLLGEDVKLATALSPIVGRVRADPGQLEQVIMNLAVNARDAMPTGGKLTIETADVRIDGANAGDHYPAPPGDYVMLAVSDTGTGMDPETQAHLFEPFFTTKEKGKGTGLGLATVYGIVKQSGGFIWVSSTLGAGSTFKIYLPRVDAAAEPIAGAEASNRVPRGSETVLVAEDEAPVRAVARQALERYGYHVLEASSAEAALDLAERYSGTIHVLLTDVIMPGLSGRELAVRLAGRRPETRVIYMSGYTDDAITRHGVLEPGFVFVQKPFTPDTLARTVRDVLHGDAARRKRA